jgi:hypothetical protein
MPSPTAVLLDVLRQRREAGDEFTDAWPRAVRLAINGVRERDERKQWRTAFEQTVSTWQASYEPRQPRPPTRARDG